MDYRQLVREVAQKHGLDPNLAEAVMAQESGGRPDARSPVGATGLMQLMPGTAKDLGVDPNDPAQNVEGGVRYLKQQIDKFGVAGGLAAYNAGPGRVMKVGGRFDALPDETKNYVPSVMNRAADIAEQRGGRVAQAQPQAPTLDVPTLIGGFEKAKAANDEEAVKEIGGLLKNKFDSALSAARQANDTEAVKEIEGMMGRYGVGATTAVAKPTSPAKPEKKTSFLQDVGLGAADALSFGFADEAYAAAASRLRGTKYEDELKTARETIDQAGPGKYLGMGASFLVPGIGVVRAANTATRLGRAAAGAATGATQGGLYGAGSAEGDLVDRATGALGGAATGAVLGGPVGALVPSTVRQEGNAIIKKAGSERAAKMDAEIIRDINQVAQNTTQRGAPVGATQLNALENKYIGDVNTALKGVGKKPLEQIGLKADDISTAIRDRRIIGEAELNALRTTKPGTALADAIEKAQRARSLTAPVPAATNPLARVGRAALDLAPIPQPLRYVGQRVLGARQTREDVASRLVSDKQAEAAANVLSRLGPSDATTNLTTLQGMANQARANQLAQAQARAQARATAKAPKVENPNAMISDVQSRDPSYIIGLSNQLGAPRNQTQMDEFSKLIRQQMEARVAKEAMAQASANSAQKAKVLGDAAEARRGLGLRGSPAGNAYQKVLDYTGVSNEQAIPVLRKLAKDNPNNEIGIAAKQLLKSNDAGVENTQAFFQIQNILKDAVGTRGGALSQATKEATSIAGTKGSEISRIVYGLADDQVVALAGRSTDTLGQSIGNLKGYLTTRAARAFETAKKNPQSVPAEDLDLLRALGVLK